MLNTLYGVLGSLEVWSVLRAADRPLAAEIERFPFRAVQGFELPQLQDLLAAAEKEIDGVAAGTTTSESAAARIRALVKETNLWPTPWGDARHPGTFTVVPFLKTAVWIERHAPPVVRENYSRNFKFVESIPYFAKDWLAELGHAGTALGTFTRDCVASWNNDWRGR
jgi:FADH2 O2-dependent halogenase